MAAGYLLHPMHSALWFVPPDPLIIVPQEGGEHRLRCRPEQGGRTHMGHARRLPCHQAVTGQQDTDDTDAHDQAHVRCHTGQTGPAEQRRDSPGAVGAGEAATGGIALTYRIYGLLTLVGLIWGASFVAARVLVATTPPLTAALLRFLLSTAILLPWLKLAETGDPRPRRRDWLLFAFLGLTGVALYNVGFFFGLKYNEAGAGALIIACNPLVIALFSVLFLGESLRPAHLAGLTLSFTGVGLVAVRGSLERLVALDFAGPHLWLAGAVLAWASFSVAGKVAMRRYSPLACITAACSFGCLFLLPAAATEWPAWLRQGGPASLGPTEWGCLLFLAVFVTVLAFVWWYSGIARIGAARAAVFINLVPLSAMVMGAVWLGESVLPYHLVGALLILGGVLLVTVSRSGRQHTPDRRAAARAAGDN